LIISVALKAAIETWPRGFGQTDVCPSLSEVLGFYFSFGFTNQYISGEPKCT
jgi:hypothetical protein